jgi:enoyl-CoA hydratase/carnithine racemase
METDMTGIVEIVMNSPGKNALGSEVMEDLTRRLREANGAPLLLTGTADAFSAGLNLKEVAGLEGEAMLSFLERLETLCATLYYYSGPTVALVNGHAIAGGCLLALFCDRRICVSNPKVKIGLNETALGLQFPRALFRMVQNRIPPQHIEEVLLQAGLHDPQNALRLGLIDAVAEDAEAAARAQLDTLAALPQQAYAATKSLIRGTYQVDEVDRAFIREVVLPVWTGPAFKARLQKVLSR